ncbi:hypothetical protein EYW49_13400 [Siculibacillus lacustris]|uniref:DUF600 family protein n=1 Tax=Siculibacillus lacustris TaxID=1549641 RepID=A0A4Q9VML9_9HYPH|nr:hypothetical protein [Siculibacillus lacustris]TBW36590.1 hypothetical protein EYW49_13400 [Siculibacillus lacustris]
MSKTVLPNEQSAIDQKIIDEVFAIIPEAWQGFIVSIEPRTGLDGGGQTIAILQPDQTAETVEPTDELRAAVAELAAWFDGIGRKWDRLVYAGYVDPTGAWHLKITAPLPD